MKQNQSLHSEFSFKIARPIGGAGPLLGAGLGLGLGLRQPLLRLWLGEVAGNRNLAKGPGDY